MTSPGRAAFDVEVEHAGGRATVRPIGELDHDTVPRLQAALIEALEAGPTVVDLQRLDFIDSAGLSALIGASQQAEAAGRTLTITGVSGMTLRLVLVTGLHRVLTFDPPIAVRR